MKGLEPPRREAPDPKSGAATNYATSALGVANVTILSYFQIYCDFTFLQVIISVQK